MKGTRSSGKSLEVLGGGRGMSPGPGRDGAEGLGWSVGRGKRLEPREVGDKTASHRKSTSAVDRIHICTVEQDS